MASAAAAAAASEPHSLPTTASSEENSCCVKCKRFQPVDGKVLACLHLICLGCLNESKDRSGCVLCSQCGQKSSPRVRGSDLSDQLASSQRLLYTSEENAGQASNSSPESSTEKQVCEVCEELHDEEDGYVVRAATHECVDCEPNRIFCDKHGEKHPRGKRYTGHSVRKLEEHGSRSSARKPQSINCVIHQLNDVITFCQTCQHGVCAQCLASGHSQHTIEALSAVATEKRASLSKSLKSLANMSQQTSDTPDRLPVSQQITTPFQTLKDRIAKEVEAIREEAKRTSEEVARYYDDLIDSLKEKRQLQLEAIDSLAWKQLEPYENRQRRLQDLEESYGTTTQLCQILTRDSKDVTDPVVIELAEHVEKKVQELSNDLQRDTQPLVPRAKIMVDFESLAATKEKMLSLVRVYESPVVDIEKSSVIMPDDVIVGIDNTIKIDLFDHTKRPIPASNTAANVTATVVSPSGKRDVIVVTRDTDISLTQIRMSLSVKPDEIGRHSLQVQSSGRTKTVNFSACDPPVLRFDPQKCSSVITLSNDNRTARHTEQSNGWGTVTTAVGYSRGRHEWNVRFTPTNAGGYSLCAGVTALPRNGDYNGTLVFFDNHRYYGWWSNGNGNHSTAAGDNCDKLQDGDTATFVLDCDQKSLEIRVHRTNTSSKITGLQCDKPLYPALCLHRPGHEAEFY